MNAGALAMQVAAINRAVTQFGCEFTSWDDVSCTDTQSLNICRNIQEDNVVL